MRERLGAPKRVWVPEIGQHACGVKKILGLMAQSYERMYMPLTSPAHAKVASRAPTRTMRMAAQHGIGPARHFCMSAGRKKKFTPGVKRYASDKENS